MKKLLTLIIFLSAIQFAQSQNVKKYLMYEHFTNTRCSVCASQNPGFFDKIANYEDDIHHVSFYPPIPYDNCALYLDNPIENENRTNFYNIVGTPRVVWNGVEQTSANNVTTFGIEERIAETSPIEVIVNETLSIQRTASITIKTVGEKPTGDLRFFAAIVEKELAYNAPNGETLHHNVYREMATDNINGENFVPAETGGQVTLEYDYHIDPDWPNINEIYILAWVQNLGTGEILNSGTRFDVPTAVNNILPKGAIFDVSPNPSNGQTFLTIEHLKLSDSKALVYNTLGQLVSSLNLQTQTKRQAIDIQHLETGTYILKIRTEEGEFTKRIVKLK